MTDDFRIYGIDELAELSKATTAKSVPLILDEATVDFLLSLRRNEESINEEEIDAMAESIEEHVLQTVGTMSVAEDRLDDGKRRLLAIKSLGCPQNLCATVVFGNSEPER